MKCLRAKSDPGPASSTPAGAGVVSTFAPQLLEAPALVARGDTLRGCHHGEVGFKKQGMRWKRKSWPYIRAYEPDVERKSRREGVGRGQGRSYGLPSVWAEGRRRPRRTVKFLQVLITADADHQVFQDCRKHFEEDWEESQVFDEADFQSSQRHRPKTGRKQSSSASRD